MSEVKRRRTKGDGSVYRQGRVWWIQYQHPDGTRRKESTRSRPQRPSRIKFVIYCFKKSKPGKEEGTVQMTDARHRLVDGRPFGHFDSYDEIGSFVRGCMAEHITVAR
jgi:hypothetical protein